jgi:hypothetical protein
MERFTTSAEDYLRYIMLKVGQEYPSQVMLYFFDSINIEYIVDYIGRRNNGTTFDRDSVESTMVEVYRDFRLKNNVSDVLSAVKKLNTDTVNRLDYKASLHNVMKRYRTQGSKPSICNYPVCTKKWQTEK